MKKLTLKLFFNQKFWKILLGCAPLFGCDADRNSGPVSGKPDIPTAPPLMPPVDRQIRRVQSQLMAANPGLTAEAIVIQVEEGQVAAMEIRDAGVTDLSPLEGLPLVLLGLAGNPISDLSALTGMPLVELDLERTQVVDLTPLRGAPLERLWLNETGVSDLAPLRQARLSQLSLLGTKVKDLSPLAGQPLEQLWLNETSVQDLGPLEGAPLVSLTLHQTPVNDLQIARTWPSLQRLHLGESHVTDLSPLDGLRLRRLILTPARIARGMDVVRRMETLSELDVEFRQPQLWSPEEFWARYDAGELTPQP